MKHTLLARFQGALLGIPAHPDTRQSLLRALDATIADRGFVADRWLTPRMASVPSAMKPIAILPLMLFLHDRLDKLAPMVTLLSQNWQESVATRDAMLVCGSLISAICTEKLPPSRGTYGFDRVRTVELLLEALNDRTTPLTEQLKIARDLLSLSAGWEQVRHRFDLAYHPTVTPIVLGIYSFLSIPADVALCLGRSRQSGNSSGVTATIAGMLAGTYNSITGIPISWYLNDAEADVLRDRASSLLAVWAGVYQGDRQLFPNFTPIAPPQLTRVY
jgi:hypothetical protein